VRFVNERHRGESWQRACRALLDVLITDFSRSKGRAEIVYATALYCVRLGQAPFRRHIMILCVFCVRPWCSSC
jgi:hypothetical protein